MNRLAVIILLASLAAITVAAAVTQRIQGSYVPCYVASGTGTTNAVNSATCTTTSGILKEIRAVNTSSTLAYVRLYDLSTGLDCTMSTGFIESIPVPAASGGPLVATKNESFFKGLSYCVTGGGGNTNNTSAPAGVYITMDYLPAH